MRSSFLALNYAIAVVLISVASENFSAFAKESGSATFSKMYVIEQKSQTMGDEVSYLSPDGLIVQVKSSGCSFYVIKPFDTIVIVNLRQKTMFQGKLAAWAGRPLKTRGFVRKSLEHGSTWQTLTASEVCNTPASHLVMVGPSPRKDEKIRGRLDYWVSKDIAVNPELADALAEINGLAHLGKVPLRYEFGLGTTTNLFDTQRISTKPLDPKLFVVPPNLKKVDMDVGVYFGVGANELDGLSSIIYRSKPDAPTAPLH